jgi:hypothetical protein
MADNTITIEHVIKGGDSNHGNVDISQLLRQQHSLLETLQSVATKLEKTIKPKTERKTPEEKQAEELAKAQSKRMEKLTKANEKTMLAHMKAHEKQNKAEMDRLAKEEKTEEKLSQLKLKNELKSYDLEQKNIADTKKIIESQAKREKQATEDFYKARNRNLSNAKSQEYSNWWQNTLNNQDDITNSAFKSKINRQTGFGWSYKTGNPQGDPSEPPTAPSKLPLQIAGILGSSLVSFLGRELDISTQYRMANAGSYGGFAGSTIMGNAMQSYPAFRAGLVQNKKQEQMSQNSSTWGILGDLIKSGGALAGGLIGSPLGLATGGMSILGGGAVGYKLVSGIADNIANYGASFKNAKISQQYDVKSAEEQRNAMLRVGMWSSQLSRYGNSNGFISRYGQDQNVLGIQNGIAPYMNSNPNEHDLSGVAQNFLKAGYSVDQFAKLTLQATQYQVISGKDIKQFSEDMKQARAKYGAGYDLGTNQTAIDLMTKGVKPEEAQKIAYQSQFNPSILPSVNDFLGNTRTSYEYKKALGDAMGLDINSLEQHGGNLKKYSTPEFYKAITKELDDFQNSDPKNRVYGTNMTMLADGPLHITPDKLLQWKSGAPDGYKGEISKDAMDASKNEAQQAGSDIIQAIQQGLSNVGNVNINAGTVTVVNGGGNTPTKGSGGSPAYSLPFPF